MDEIILWNDLLSVIEPCYYEQSKVGPRPYPPSLSPPNLRNVNKKGKDK